MARKNDQPGCSASEAGGADGTSDAAAAIAKRLNGESNKAQRGASSRPAARMHGGGARRVVRRRRFAPVRVSEDPPLRATRVPVHLRCTHSTRRA